jgi:glycosyltransferase involved in cell wall biosynthesis
LELVLESYFSQELVTELVFVLDAGQDQSEQTIATVAARFPEKRVLTIQNPQRMGASRSRNVGVASSSNPYILFCDDDEYLEEGYAKVCLEKLRTSGAGAVSGRRVYMLGSESPAEALARFGCGVYRKKLFRPWVCETVNGAIFEGDVELPFTNAIILTTRELLLRFPFDGFYSRGNGFREETDFQMNLFVNGYRIVVTNERHSIHLPLTQVRTGGQRTATMKRIYWSIYYTNYFFRKYYADYATRSGLRAPRWLALIAFSGFSIYRETLRPVLQRLWGYFVPRFFPAPRSKPGASSAQT